MSSNGSHAMKAVIDRSGSSCVGQRQSGFKGGCAVSVHNMLYSGLAGFINVPSLSLLSTFLSGKILIEWHPPEWAGHGLLHNSAWTPWAECNPVGGLWAI